EARHEALVTLVADGVEGDRRVGGAVVADRRHALLRHRQLERQRARRRDDLRPRRGGGDEPRRRCEDVVDCLAAPVAEGDEERRHERDDREDDEADEAASAAGGAALTTGPRPRAGTRTGARLRACAGRRRLHRRAGGHARHRNGGLRRVQPGPDRPVGPQLLGVERERSVLEERPLPGGRPESDDVGGTMARMPGGATKIEIPRWIQLVGLPLLLLLLWVVAGAARHVVFLFLVAGLIALLLNPLVRGLGRVWIPRGLAVAIVYLTFAAAVALAVIALATVVVDQTRHASHRVDNYFTVDSGRLQQTGAEQDLARLQHWLNGHHLKRVRVEKQGTKFLNSIGTKDVQKYTAKALTWAEGASLAVFGLLFSIVLVIVVSVYMLLDMHRLAAAVDRRFPPYPGSLPLIERMERALASYVKGQLALSLISGLSAGSGLWALGMVGLMPHGGRYAVLFGIWAGITELIPYIGPWLGAAPP